MCVYTHHAILLGHKEGNFAICNNMDRLGRYYDKWNKSDRERHIYHLNVESKNTTNYWLQQKNKQTHREQISGEGQHEGRGLSGTNYYV